MIIGISGVARAGKNSFAKFAAEFFESKGLSCDEFAFATELKADLEDFILEKTGISVWTEDSEEKEIIRPLMVEYGKIQREMTAGMYWVEKLLPHMEVISSNIQFVTDVRYPNDEVAAIHDRGGKVIHVTRYNLGDAHYKEEYAPANVQEAKNDPLVKEKADLRFAWDDFTGCEAAARQNVFNFLEKSLDKLGIRV